MLFTSITGNIDGSAITGELGPGGSVSLTPDGAFLSDNAIFLSDSSGANGSIHGIDNDGLGFTVGDLEYSFFSDSGTLDFVSYNTSTAAESMELPVTVTSTDVPCFCLGTRILTENGERPVESLSIGDRLRTVQGAAASIRWIGHRTLHAYGAENGAGYRLADPLRVMPIRIKAGALAEAVPSRDLRVSPEHAFLIDGVLVQAGALVNGLSVVRETIMPESFTYYHVEVEDHALILAEGAPAETFVDNVNRLGFDNWAEHEALYPDATPIPEMDYPRATSQRQVPRQILQHLTRRARVLLTSAREAVAA